MEGMEGREARKQFVRKGALEEEGRHERENGMEDSY